MHMSIGFDKRQFRVGIFARYATCVAEINGFVRMVATTPWVGHRTSAAVSSKPLRKLGDEFW